MTFRSAHIAELRGCRGSQFSLRKRQRQWKSTLSNVKKLYLDRRYKQCAALCDETLKGDITGIHPLHKTFLHVFAAFCYESLGLLAHKFSSNRLPFLHLAKDQFASASATLPLAYASDESGGYSSPAISPVITGFASVVSHDPYETATTTPLSNSPTPLPLSASSRPSSASSSTHSQDGSPSKLTDMVPNFDDYSPRRSIGFIQKPTVAASTFREAGRDEQECASKELVNSNAEEDLVPMPLFFKKAVAVDMGRVEPLLSPLPTAEKQIVQRKTAIRHIMDPVAHLTRSPSPSTPEAKFGRIDPSQQVPGLIPIHHSLPAYLSSRSLARYNEYLASFRSQLHAHLECVDEAIAQTTFQQKEHKTRQGKRLASYWSFRPSAMGQDGEDAKAVEKRERIERLRKEGWRVTMERYGWRGSEYYADLRTRALAELNT